ncbi:MAG: AmmeMemoRadiSam system protein B [Candidatus Diapherotrites archaeon]
MCALFDLSEKPSDFVRRPSVAGSFYPVSKKELSNLIDNLLERAKTFSLSGTLRALVCPHAGFVYSGVVAAVAYKQLFSRQNESLKVLILGPSHFVAFSGAAVSGYLEWETPLGRVRTLEVGFPEFYPAHLDEHSIEVQLPFLQKVLKNFTINPIVVGDYEPKSLAIALEPLVDDKTLVIASSDLSHYHSYKKAVALDSVANKAIPSLDFDSVEGIEACGKIPVIALMYLAKRFSWKGVFLDYKNSGDTAGDRQRVVGYGAYAFYE